MLAGPRQFARYFGTEIPYSRKTFKGLVPGRPKRHRSYMCNSAQYDCWGKIWKAWRGCTSLHYAQFHWVKLSFVRSFRNIRNWGGQWWDRPFLGSVFCLWHGHAEFLWTFLTQAGPCRTYLFYEFVNKFSDNFFWKRSAWLDALLRYGVIDILEVHGLCTHYGAPPLLSNTSIPLSSNRYGGI